MNYSKICNDSIVGVNYSGMHDTSVTLISPTGEIIFAVSLERLTRKKQDGRHPDLLLKDIPWEKVSKVAFSVEGEYAKGVQSFSKFHDKKLSEETSINREHLKEFYDVVNSIPVEKVFVPHHLAHASSSFWLSDFSDAVCLVYDGGMSNEDVFGGVFFASRDKGISLIDTFDANKYGNVTHIYSAVTAILGFSPMRHEGKITGLAAHGSPKKGCIDILDLWMKSPELISGLVSWKCVYDNNLSPELLVNEARLKDLQDLLSEYSREDIAASVQMYAEEHVVEILTALANSDIPSKNLCLSGGLFANVKINQKARSVYKNIFVSPPMSDDGTSLGAALHVASFGKSFSPSPCHSMYLGPNYQDYDFVTLLDNDNIVYSKPDELSSRLADILSSGKIVAVYRGASEFGPRALGNRSILANADSVEINEKLNKLLGRTEFMPFAPICLKEDSDILFNDMDGIRHTAEFMTITVDCSEYMKHSCPAVVHCDGTARPQLITKENNGFIYDVLHKYKKDHSKPALVNTSFNIHEEPIVCSPEDALRGFFESGLDYLCIDNFLIDLDSNRAVQARYLKEKILKMHADIKANKKDILDSRKKREVSVRKRKALLRRSAAKQSSLESGIEKLIQENKKIALDSRRINQAYLDIYHSTSWKFVRAAHPAVDLVKSVFKAKKIDYAQIKYSNPNIQELVIDVTHLYKEDLKTGIQRVSRAISFEIYQALNAKNYAVRTIFLDNKGLYRYCDNKKIVSLKKHDSFLGLDLNARVCDIEEIFSVWVNRGVRINFVVYDILPIIHPHWWSENVCVAHDQWLQTVLRYSNKIACISKTVANDVIDYANSRVLFDGNVDKVQSFPLGADIEKSEPSSGVPSNMLDIAKKMSSQITFLMVGTVEPRKGYREVLEAFDELWSKGHEFNLAIVGKRGWMMDDFLIRVKSHQNINESLFYYDKASDEFLEELYKNSDCLIAASEAEGFGLPLIEGARYGLPIIARDIPIFKEVAGEHAMYFHGGDLPAVILQWVKSYESGEHVRSKDIGVFTWRQSANSLLNIIDR